jgi:hypothetical protein
MFTRAVMRRINSGGPHEVSGMLLGWVTYGALTFLIGLAVAGHAGGLLAATAILGATPALPDGVDASLLAAAWATHTAIALAAWVLGWWASGHLGGLVGRAVDEVRYGAGEGPTVYQGQEPE